MSKFNHWCPELSPNSTRPNITASSCKSKIAARIGKCARCASGVGYVAPPAKVKKTKVKGKKEITERLSNPRPVKKRKPRNQRVENCACGEKREPKKSHCEPCRVKHIAASREKFLLKALLRRRVVLDKRIAEAKKIISDGNTKSTHLD